MEERVKYLIKYAAEFLSDAELLEENGWQEGDTEILNKIATTDFDFQFKE